MHYFSRIIEIVIVTTTLIYNKCIYTHIYIIIHNSTENINIYKYETSWIRLPWSDEIRAPKMPLSVWHQVENGTGFVLLSAHINIIAYDMTPSRSSCFRITLFVNSFRPRRNRRHLADDIFKYISLNENVLISIEISLKFISKGPINTIPALVQLMAWYRPGDKPLSEPVMVYSLTHICVTWPQWVKMRIEDCVY